MQDMEVIAKILSMVSDPEEMKRFIAWVQENAPEEDPLEVIEGAQHFVHWLITGELYKEEDA